MRPRGRPGAPTPAPDKARHLQQKSGFSDAGSAAGRLGAVRTGPGPLAAGGRGGCAASLSLDHPPPPRCCPGLLPWGPHTLGRACALPADPGQSPALQEPPGLGGTNQRDSFD